MALVIPVAEVLLVPVGVDPRTHTNQVRYDATGLGCPSQARGDDARRLVTDERAHAFSRRTGLTQALGVQRGVDTPRPVKACPQRCGPVTP